ncbi:MAG: transposase [Ignavibacteria bacterium]|nr:transposase [Ignavibacteria bacterium]
MKHYFGRIYNQEMIVSPEGRIVTEEWLKTPEVRNYVILDQFVVMPNHFHAIIALMDNPGNNRNNTSSETTHRVVSTNGTLKPDSLGSIVGQFKSICTKRIRKEINKDFKWQDSFYDRVIRDEKELDNEREYIIYNPIRWNNDEFFS